MITFKAFILEGGNVRIGDVEAERIDLSKLDRRSITTRIARTLKMVNLRFQKKYGVPIWNKELFDSREFLSGSAFHFFNRAIPDEVFKKYKNTVGDVDTQVDKAQEQQVKEFLDSIVGQKFGYVTFVGYKTSVGQFITLWAFSSPKINIQIDLEFVDFAEGRPTEWSQFSHSSAWEDLEAGIKGVFQKYLLRALTTKTLRDIIILKGKKETPTQVKSTDLAFSVTQGLRVKIEPVIENGKHKMIDGLQVYKEIPTKQSSYVNDLKQMFEILFGVAASAKDIKDFGSFVGGLDLVKKHFNVQEMAAVILGFAWTLWGPGAQGLYRADPERDKNEKMVAFNKMVNVLKVPYDHVAIESMRANYYKAYKE